MTLWLRDLMDRFEHLSLRERVLVLGALLAVLLLVWDGIFMSPLERERKQHAQMVEALRAEVTGLEKSVEAIAAQASADPNREVRAQIEQLRKNLPDLDAQLAGATSGLIEPKEMGRVLEQLLGRTSKLQLRALRTLPPEAVIAPLVGDEAALKAGSAQIYKHGLELELSGSYLDVLRFLQSLESLQWRFFWDRVEFAVEEYPRGRVKLTLYTLSLHEGWVGV